MKKLLGVLLILSVWMTGCNQVFTEYKDIPQLNWERDNVVTFDFESPGTDKDHTMLVGFRHYSYIEYAEILVNVTMTSPSGGTSNDRYIIHLRDKETGELRGGSMGDLTDLEVPVKNDIAFEEAGTYHFEIVHEMEQDVVSGIMEVGLVIKENEDEDEAL